MPGSQRPQQGWPGTPARTGRPAGPYEPATQNLPPVTSEPVYSREPDLLTHRDDDHATNRAAMNGYDHGRSGYRAGQGLLSEADRKALVKQKIFRRSRRTLYALVGLGIVAPIVGFFIAYQIVKVPDPQTVAAGLNQPITIYYADNSVMTTIGTRQNAHQLITTADLPKLQNAVHAVEAAEDETFQTNAGVDLKAIIRTAYHQATGGGGGASTITQEYIKQATNPGFIGSLPLTTKIGEVVKAYKMSRTVPKDQVMAGYLNIVYFGRGAYGIGAAAQVYYGEKPEQLTVPQAALLAGLIQSPGRGFDKPYEQTRYSYVMGRMAVNHWLGSTPANAPLPKSLPPSDGASSLPWDRQLIVDQVKAELSKDGLNLDSLQRMGAKVYTSIQPAAQTDAENSVKTAMANDSQFTGGGPLMVHGRPIKVDGVQIKATEAAALVSVDPQTGEILAWYGGDDPKATQYDLADTPQSPGSSFKPYVFAGALEKDPSQVGLTSVYNGSDNQNIKGTIVHNAEGDASGPVDVKKAMTQSINTAFYNMGVDEGVQNVALAAHQAGIPQTERASGIPGNPMAPTLVDLNPKTGKSTGVVAGGISIGQYPVKPRDQAQGYATLANYGNYIPIHFVTKVINSDGSTVYTFSTPAKPAFGDAQTSESIAHTVIDSMTNVASADNLDLSQGRPVAAKTGTQGYNDPVTTAPYHNNVVSGSGNSDAWMVGFTPSVVTAVWFGHYDRVAPIYGNLNNTDSPSQRDYNVFGHTDPGFIWQTYMNSYLGNSPPQQFTKYPDINGSWNFMTNQPISQYTPPSSSNVPTNPAGNGGNTPTSSPPDTTTTTTKETPTPPTFPTCVPFGGCPPTGGTGVGPGGKGLGGNGGNGGHGRPGG